MDVHYIDEVLAGNADAFGYFIRRYQDKAYGVAISIVKQDEDAKDVVQDSFITAYSSLSDFRREAKFSVWLYRIVINKALQFLKREKRKTEISTEFSIASDERTTLNHALSGLQTEELKKLIKAVFVSIPPKEALVLQLHYIDNQSLAEIEEITRFTKANIKVLLHRARASFYKVLKQKNIKQPY